MDKAQQHAVDAVRDQQFVNTAQVVIARFFIEQVRTRQVRLAALECEQPRVGTHVRRDHAQGGRAPAQQVRQQIERHVVAANRQNRIVNAARLNQ